MLNYIWMGMMAIAVIVGIFTGNIDAVTQSAIDSAATGVEIALGLIGVMALWLGLMKIAEEAGFIQMIGKALNPIMKRLFPEVPEDHPAMGAMVMNLAANILGLGNAATPFGIKAMKELQTLNEEKETATNAMVMFLAINTSSVTLIPATVIALRASAGSENVTEVIGPIILTTIISTTVAIIAAKFFKTENALELKNRIYGISTFNGLITV